MTRSEGPSIKVNYQVAGGPAISGTVQTRGVTLQVSPLGELAEKPDFSLLGLTGKGGIAVLFDPESDLPLQLRGTAPRIGNAEINLKTVTLREPSA
jgi:hypothetical protein